MCVELQQKLNRVNWIPMSFWYSPFLLKKFLRCTVLLMGEIMPRVIYIGDCDRLQGNEN